MATFHDQLLVNNTTRKASHCKTLSLLLFFVALIAFTTLYSVVFLKSKPHDHSNGDQDHGRVDSHVLLQVFLKKSSSRIQHTVDVATDISRRINDPSEKSALDDCVFLMDISIDRVKDSILALESKLKTSQSNAHTWLSSVLTNHVTCLDGLIGPIARPIMESKILDLIRCASSSLEMLVALSPIVNDEVFEPLDGNFPSWINGKDRKLLQTSALGNVINANVVVAKDGSGNYETVKEAIASAPDKGKTRYVIYVKKGTYKENVEIGKKKTNVMITGDGMDLTIITGSLNVVDGSTTFNSSTIAAVGDGFMAQDICIQNTAGAAKHQAVALRVGSDQAVINRCKIDAYQDTLYTLYTHSNRQFYRDCYITGTVDFIFGNAAVVFQNSEIVARKGMSGQKNMLTAQGRTDPNQNTGTSIQSCSLIGSSDLDPVKSTYKSYLGRPWKEYSRTVVMQSTIGDHIDSTGWAPWDKDFALKTLYYGEYMNQGAGAGTSNRVTWAGYHVITSADEAKNFTVAQLIQGASWIQTAGVTFTEGL